MRSLILSTAVHLLFGLMILFSLFLLLRGHNLPGGGFVGGLVAAIAFTLFAIADSAAAVRRVLRIDPRYLVVAGLAVALLSGLFKAAAGMPYLTGAWVHPGGLPLGTPLLFDVGVYLTVVGSVLTLVLTMEEER